MIRRRIAAGVELTLAYEPQTTSFSPTNLVGGAYPVMQCNCASMFCIGEIMRRFQEERQKPNDYEFISVVLGTKSDPAKLLFDVEMLADANMFYVRARNDPKNADIEDVDLEEEAVQEAKTRREQRVDTNVSGKMCYDRESTATTAREMFKRPGLPMSMAVKQIMSEV